MSTRERIAAGVLVCLLPVAGLAAQGPALGEPVPPEVVRSIDFTVLPDGTGLPRGEGDAAAGLVVYQSECGICHGDGGQGGPNDRLVGGRGSLAAPQPVKTVGSFWPYATTLFDYVRRTMPIHAPGTLTSDQIYAVTAYLLFANGIIDEDAVMNARTLPKVRMPNRDGFVWALPEAE
ncbi:MAG: c-type cytochrome [Pseudomonadales bacterium]